MMVPWRARIPDPRDWPPPSRKGWPEQPNHDGDSVRLLIDRYDDDSSVWNVRLLAVFCPEVVPLQPGGQECRAELLRLLREYDDGSKWPFWVDSVPSPSDPGKPSKTFDRYICLVSNASRTRVLNHDISAFVVEHGYGGGTGS